MQTFSQWAKRSAFGEKVALEMWINESGQTIEQGLPIFWTPQRWIRAAVHRYSEHTLRRRLPPTSAAADLMATDEAFRRIRRWTVLKSNRRVLQIRNAGSSPFQYARRTVSALTRSSAATSLTDKSVLRFIAVTFPRRFSHAMVCRSDEPIIVRCSVEGNRRARAGENVNHIDSPMRLLR